ncbi:Por secretion system C-terminal sorting domain-containing protein [Marivirga sericea]|uniref:Por secretion system C-terminal sorting domain-containing protein n=1 Tax=Marivirga sericea TaxID=1028 RepID=A0A1X7IKX1_9BACT|nr:S8 family serine peptidase [Marivirga sericea]SMG15623.1 Por secretion system C-terminal sorting domain-containing protein [Marivirga sericea]
MKYILPLLLSLFIIQQSLAQDYVPGLIVVKLKQEDQLTRKDPLKQLSFVRLQEDALIENIQDIKSQVRTNQRTAGNSRLDNLYKLEINERVNEKEYIAYLRGFENVEYAEQYPNVKPLYVPNDPEAQFGQAQFHLAQINIYDAWNVSQGNEDIVIGVIDTGADLDHEDLEGNLYLNEADPIDGIDNDNDGYTDNYFGWDFADNDNSPEADGSTHGTGVSGIAAASTDNSKGIAGVGFNTKFMPIKIFKTENNFSRNSYEGIIYAADQGCDIINLSWGSAGGYSQFAQDIINYAVLEKDVVVVAAAGNTNAELDFYPASYDNVLSIGYVNSDDSRNINATYSDFIDLVAPGVGIYTTENDNTYDNDSGSSYAAPMVAGAAALIRSVFPEWNALQVMEQLRVSSDDISDVGSNSDLQYKFGKGRLNVFKAIANFDTPAIRISDLSYSNGLEEAAYFGDTLEITLEFTNYLESTENVDAKLTSSSPYVNIIQADYTIESLETFEKISTQNGKYRVILSENLPEDEALNFRILFEGEFYQDYQSFQIQSSPKIRLFNYNGWNFGFTATGNFGRSAETPFDNYAVTHNGSDLIDHMGLVLFAGDDSLVRNTLIGANSFQYIDDFQSFKSLKRYDDITADFDVRSVFTEKNEVPISLDLYIDQRFLGWDDEKDFLIHQYRVENRSENSYDSLYFTLFTDYALADKNSNTLKYDSALQLSYAYDEAATEYVGLSLLSIQDSVFFAFDLGDENLHTSDLENDSLKQDIIQNALRNAFSKQLAGEKAGGNNVGSIQGVLLKDFEPFSVHAISLAVMRADNLNDLKSLVTKAKKKDSLSFTLPPFGRQVFICKNDSPTISAPENHEYDIYTSATDETILYSGTDFEVGNLSKDSIFYVVERDSLGIEGLRKRLVISIQEPVANFSLPSDTLLINQEEVNSFRFQDESENASSWKWKFSNGFISQKQHPNIIFDSVGDYSAELIIGSAIGCHDTVTKSFKVFNRSRKPQVGDLEVCINEDLILQDPSIGQLAVYSDSLLTTKIYQGPTFIFENLSSDTLLYVRNESDQFPSETIQVEVKVIPLKARMEVILDMSSENKQMRALATSKSDFSQDHIWMINDDTLGTQNEINFELRKLQTGDLKLIAISENNCRDTVTFQNTASQNPEFENYYLCQSESVTISALNSEKVYYFEDSELTQFIGKGANVNIAEVSEDMSVFAVNVENVYPSEVIEVPIFVSDLTAEFSISHDTINLAFEKEIQLEALSSSSSNWNWKINNSTIASKSSVIHSLSEAGVFKVQLNVEDTLGCIAVAEKQLVVFNDPLLGSNSELKSYFSIFPNPADKFIHLTGKDQFKFDTYSIIDTQGKEVLKANNSLELLQSEIIDISDLKQGAYYLIIRKGKNEASFLFVISR